MKHDSLFDVGGCSVAPHGVGISMNQANGMRF